MRRFCSPLALLMLATSSGCTLAIQLAASSKVRSKEMPVDDVRDGADVTVVTRDGRAYRGAWAGVHRSADGGGYVEVRASPQSFRFPVDDVAHVRREQRSIGPYVLAGFAVDVALAAAVGILLTNTCSAFCEPDGSGE